MNEVKQVIARVVHYNAARGERDARGAKLEGHLDEGRVLVQIFKRIQGHILILLGLVDVFFIHSIIVIGVVTFIEPLVLHVFQLGPHW